MIQIQPRIETKRSLILVARPINFLYAIELCKSYPEKEFIILIFPNTNRLELNAISFLRSEFEKFLPNVRFKYFYNFFPKDILNLILFKLYIQTVIGRRKYEIFSTSGGVKGRLLFRHLNLEKVVITEEGRPTSFKRFPETVRNGIIFRKPLGERYIKMYKFLGIYDLKNEDNYCILTMYKDLLKYGDKICLNQFRHLKKLIEIENYQINRREIIILGSNPHKIGLKEKDYIAILEKVFAEHKGYNIKLKTHKTFNDALGFKTLETDLPIEYYFIEQKRVPEILMSFGSTSNQILEYLFPEIIVRNLIESPDSLDDEII